MSHVKAFSAWNQSTIEPVLRQFIAKLQAGSHQVRSRKTLIAIKRSASSKGWDICNFKRDICRKKSDKG